MSEAYLNDKIKKVLEETTSISDSKEVLSQIHSDETEMLNLSLIYDQDEVFTDHNSPY